MKRTVSLLITFALIISTIGVLPTTSYASSTEGYYDIIEDYALSVGFSTLDEYDKKQCKGFLYDLNDDGQEELIVQYLKKGSSAYSVWSMLDGKPVCLLEDPFLSGRYVNMYVAEYGGKTYFVLNSWIGGSDGGYIEWLFYDVNTNPYKLAYNLGEGSNYDGSGTSTSFVNKTGDNSTYKQVYSCLENSAEIPFENEALMFDALLETLHSGASSEAEHPYISIIKGALETTKNVYSSSEGWGMLYDVDDNGIEELIMVYSDYVNSQPTTVCSIYTTDGTYPIALCDQTRLFPDVGGVSGYVSVSQNGGSKYIEVHANTTEVAGDEGYFSGFWVVSSVDGTTLVREAEVKFEGTHNYKTDNDLFQETYILIDGKEVDYQTYKTWAEGFKKLEVITIGMADEEQTSGVVTLRELIDILRNADNGGQAETTKPAYTVEEIEKMIADYYNQNYYSNENPGKYVVFHADTYVKDNNCNTVVRFQSSIDSPDVPANVVVAFVAVNMITGKMTIETVDGNIDVQLFEPNGDNTVAGVPSPVLTMSSFNNFFAANYYENLNKMYQYDSAAMGIVENSTNFQINWNSSLSALSNKEYIDITKFENHPEYYYQTVLFESLLQTKLDDDYLAALAGQILNSSIDALSYYVSFDANFNNYEEALKQKLNTAMTDFSIDSVQYNRLKDYYGQYCEQIASYETMKGIYDLVVEADGTIEDFFTALSNYSSIRMVSDESVAALKYLKAQLEASTNAEDQYILKAVTNVLASLERTMNEQLLLNCMGTAKDLLWGVFWAAIEDAFPKMLAMDIANFTIDTGLALSNVFFPTTISADSYCKVYADYAIETVTRKALNEAYTTYAQNPTEELATITVGLYDLLSYTYAHEIEVASVLSEQLHKDGLINGIKNLFVGKNMETYEYEQACIEAYRAYLNEITAVKIEAQTEYGLATGTLQPVVIVYMVNGKVLYTSESVVTTGETYDLTSTGYTFPDFIDLRIDIGGYYTDEKLTTLYSEEPVTKPLSLYCNLLLSKASDGTPVLVDHSTGISVSCGTGMTNYTLQTQAITEGSLYDTVTEDHNGADIDLYDISLYEGDESVQPSEQVTVEIPVDKTNANRKGTVYHVDRNGNYENMNAVYENQAYRFETTHFSNFVIVYESSSSIWPVLIIIISVIIVAGATYTVWTYRKKKNSKQA